MSLREFIIVAGHRSEMHEKLVLSTLINHPDSIWEVPGLCADHFYANLRDWFAIVRDEMANGSRAKDECGRRCEWRMKPAV